MSRASSSSLKRKEKKNKIPIKSENKRKENKNCSCPERLITIEKLLSSSGFDTILVIVDWLTKQAIFISAHDTIMSADLARLFILHVFSKHGVPSHVTSNRGSEFVSNFF